MKILIIGPGKMKYMPYIHFYLDNINWKAHDMHVAYWNRDEKDENLSQFEGLHLHEFKRFMVNDAPLKTKLCLFYSFRRFCVKLIKKHDFDCLIVLHSIPGVVLYDWLVKRYGGKYIFDYRDSTYEPRVKFFKTAVGNIIRCSRITFTSSDGFREYFPKDCKDKIITSHNLLEDSLKHREYKRICSEKIRIAFWGFIRHAELNKFLIDRIGNDERFELHYYGREQIDAYTLKEYVRINTYSNIFFHGEYKPEDRYEFAKKTDIIHNIYLDDNTLRAMGNKYYDGVIFRIPQICFPGSQMAKMSNDAQIGISLDPRDSGFCDTLCNYYNQIDKVSFNRFCDVELNRILLEYNRGCEIISGIFSNSL